MDSKSSLFTPTAIPCSTVKNCNDLAKELFIETSVVRQQFKILFRFCIVCVVLRAVCVKMMRLMVMRLYFTRRLIIYSWLLRATGAFFIRRRVGDTNSAGCDQLYRSVLNSYMCEVLREGIPIEFFLEGTRYIFSSFMLQTNPAT